MEDQLGCVKRQQSEHVEQFVGMHLLKWQDQKRALKSPVFWEGKYAVEERGCCLFSTPKKVRYAPFTPFYLNENIWLMIRQDLKLNFPEQCYKSDNFNLILLKVDNFILSHLI